ncbi:MAG: stage II sporulation protein M [Anaerolineae bacterium]|nr:stage II sporulation protein M [Anaerolineae bacterium]
MTTQTIHPLPVQRGWREVLSNALIITRREVRDSFRDWRIIAPIIILTFAFPMLAQFLAGSFLNFVSDYGAEIIGERTIPFLLMIVGFFPISISLVIALETFVGEKERRSLEPLLSTPLSNTELYIGKTLAAMIPPLAASLGGMAVYLFSLLGGDLAWRPPLALIVQIILLTVTQALVMVTGAVVVSSQTTSTRAANLLASFIIIPVTLLVQAESVIMFLAPDAESPSGISALWAIIVGMLVATILLLRVGNAVFNREELLGRTIDQLNLRGTFRSLWRWTKSVDSTGTPARSLLHWYRAGVFPAVGRLGLARWIVIAVFLFALVGGYIVGQSPEWQLRLPQDARMQNAAQMIEPLLNVPTQSGALLAIIWQNGRILLGALALSIITFGAASLILTPAVYFILGYLFSQILAAGYNPAFMFAAVFTHGIIEIPVIVLATAAALRMGAVVTKPPQGIGVGQAWSMTFGDTLKIALGLVLPGLVLAAFIEAFITPGLVVAVLSAS